MSVLKYCVEIDKNFLQFYSFAIAGIQNNVDANFSQKGLEFSTKDSNNIANISTPKFDKNHIIYERKIPMHIFRNILNTIKENNVKIYFEPNMNIIFNYSDKNLILTIDDLVIDN